MMPEPALQGKVTTASSHTNDHAAVRPRKARSFPASAVVTFDHRISHHYRLLRMTCSGYRNPASSRSQCVPADRPLA